CSPAATAWIRTTARRSPRQAPGAWPRSRPNAGSRHRARATEPPRASPAARRARQSHVAVGVYPPAQPERPPARTVEARARGPQLAFLVRRQVAARGVDGLHPHARQRMADVAAPRADLVEARRAVALAADRDDRTEVGARQTRERPHAEVRLERVDRG